MWGRSSVGWVPHPFCSFSLHQPGHIFDLDMYMYHHSSKDDQEHDWLHLSFFKKNLPLSPYPYHHLHLPLFLFTLTSLHPAWLNFDCSFLYLSLYSMLVVQPSYSILCNYQAPYVYISYTQITHILRKRFYVFILCMVNCD